MSRDLDSMLMRFICAIIFVFALGAAGVGFTRTGPDSGRVVVELKSGASAEDFCSRNGLRLIDSIEGGALLVEADAATLAQAAADTAVASTEPDLPVTLSETAVLDPAVLDLLTRSLVLLSRRLIVQYLVLPLRSAKIAKPDSRITGLR